MLDKVFLMPEGYRHDIQHGNQCGPQRLPDISIASLHVFECDVNEKTPVQCMNTLRWSRKGNRPILNIPEPPKRFLYVWNQISWQSWSVMTPFFQFLRKFLVSSPHPTSATCFGFVGRLEELRLANINKNFPVGAFEWKQRKKVWIEGFQVDTSHSFSK